MSTKENEKDFELDKKCSSVLQLKFRNGTSPFLLLRAKIVAHINSTHKSDLVSD